jgi:hypothetical protein
MSSIRAETTGGQRSDQQHTPWVRPPEGMRGGTLALVTRWRASYGSLSAETSYPPDLTMPGVEGCKPSRYTCFSQLRTTIILARWAAPDRSGWLAC